MTLDLSSIVQTLLENLPWNKARIKFVTRFLLALFAVQTINLSIIATAFSGRVIARFHHYQPTPKDFYAPADLSLERQLFATDHEY
jgi:hypothetical protein